ncbi:hypothetical protein BASA61_002988 [Batrachochytrium salamandrivorans]|nr:hypothetical protein BASA61_002988 [Batrachochytrium salamandrivorans]
MKVAAATIISLVAVSAYASPAAYSANQEVNTHGSTIGSSANAYLEKRGGGMHGDYAQGATGADDPPPNNQNHAPPPARGHQQQYQENRDPSSLHEMNQHAQSVEGGNNAESNVETAGDKSEDSAETDESESESDQILKVNMNSEKMMNLEMKPLNLKMKSLLPFSCRSIPLDNSTEIWTSVGWTGTVEHESMGTRHDNRALAARLADFLQVAYRQYQSTLWKYHRDRLVEVG